VRPIDTEDLCALVLSWKSAMGVWETAGAVERIASNLAILFTCLLCTFSDISCSMRHHDWFPLRPTM